MALATEPDAPKLSARTTAKTKAHKARSALKPPRASLPARHSARAAARQVKATPLLSTFRKEFLKSSYSEAFEDNKGETFEHYHSRDTIGNEVSPPDLPTATTLRITSAFGKPSKHHSFTQTGAGETCMHIFLKYGACYLTIPDIDNLRRVHPLLEHLDRMREKSEIYDFRWLQNHDRDWAQRRSVCVRTARANLMALMHYDMDVSQLVRFRGNNFTGAYRNVDSTIEILASYDMPQYLISAYRRVMTVGCPAHFVAETSRDNALEFWRNGNNPSILNNLENVMRAMTKEFRNDYIIALPHWVFRFVPHLMFTPQHYLTKPGKNDRIIFDAAFRPSPRAENVNSMTSTDTGVELDCQYGDVLKRVLTRIWNLRLSYPDKEIVIHASDVKSCFRQLKHHPSVAGAFSYIMGDFLFIQCALAFGADFSPQSWEVVRRLAEMLSERLFGVPTLRDKHRQYLDLLRFGDHLGDPDVVFVPATPDSKNTGVSGSDGRDPNTPHAYFVDDDIYTDIFDLDATAPAERIEQAVAAGIEAVFILLGASDLSLRQDPLSWEKLRDFIISFRGKVLGVVVCTRSLSVSVPTAYLASTTTLLRDTWGGHRKSFLLREITELTGTLCHISGCAPWLKFLMPHLYCSITSALGLSYKHLITSQKGFREMVKAIKRQGSPTKKRTNADLRSDPAAREVSFFQSKVGKAVHHTKTKFYINRTLKAELKLLLEAFTSPEVSFSRPIAHLVDRDNSGLARGDSSLKAAGGYSVDMQFWWHLEWPEAVRRRTLLYIKNNDDNSLISINVLEYATTIINYVAATHFFTSVAPNPADPYPIVQIDADNTSSESWLVKGTTVSFIGRALGRLQCALMINNPVAAKPGHITTTDNFIADGISRVDHSRDAETYFKSLHQDYPQLRSCRRFHPSAELISAVIRILLEGKLDDPIQLSKTVLGNLGRSTS